MSQDTRLAPAARDCQVRSPTAPRCPSSASSTRRPAERGKGEGRRGEGEGREGEGEGGAGRMEEGRGEGGGRGQRRGRFKMRVQGGICRVAAEYCHGKPSFKRK